MTDTLTMSGTGLAELFAAYAKAQASMGALIKGAVNPAFRSRYADLAAVVDAVMPAMNAAGLAIIQAPSYDGEVLTVETLAVHTAGGWIRSALSVRPAKPDAQGLGSAITYLRRYALMALAGVAPEDDDGNAASSHNRSASPPIAAKNLAALIAEAEVLSGEGEITAWTNANLASINALPETDKAGLRAALKQCRTLVRARDNGAAPPSA